MWCSPSEQAHAGTARRLAMDGRRRLGRSGRLRRGPVVDGCGRGSRPGSGVAANLAALAAGGARRRPIGDRKRSRRVDSRGRAPRPNRPLLGPAVRALEDRIDPPAHDPAPRHGDHTGGQPRVARPASIAKSAACRRSRACEETMRWSPAVTRLGGRVRHCPDVWIEVSARGDRTGGWRHGARDDPTPRRCRDGSTLSPPGRPMCGARISCVAPNGGRNGRRTGRAFPTRSPMSPNGTPGTISTTVLWCRSRSPSLSSRPWHRRRSRLSDAASDRAIMSIIKGRAISTVRG